MFNEIYQIVKILKWVNGLDIVNHAYLQGPLLRTDWDESLGKYIFYFIWDVITHMWGYLGMG